MLKLEILSVYLFFKYHYNLHNFYTKFHNIENYHYLQLSIILTQIFK